MNEERIGAGVATPGDAAGCIISSWLDVGPTTMVCSPKSQPTWVQTQAGTQFNGRFPITSTSLSCCCIVSYFERLQPEVDCYQGQPP
ncbi:unnamed protein product [Pleuronectes platessa]|uniref:Uncharacterized protein n=1 Tax=Pleuronectes platessa TaxID=8262 RepID=A0A9N7TXQ6_PLEPL|nr:unnamed protein product [Pleuronectes platessa]